MCDGRARPGFSAILLLHVRRVNSVNCTADWRRVSLLSESSGFQSPRLNASAHFSPAGKTSSQKSARVSAPFDCRTNIEAETPYPKGIKQWPAEE